MELSTSFARKCTRDSVVIKGLENLSFNTFWNRHVRIAFLDPIYPVDVIGMKEEEIARMVREQIAECYNSL